MMGNAGLQLANLIAHSVSKNQIINIGVGNGNNGGRGLVAARRLAAWGYKLHLGIPYSISNELPAMQLKRALAFGVDEEPQKNAHVWVDAYFGFSQRLPLPEDLIAKIKADSIPYPELRF